MCQNFDTWTGKIRRTICRLKKCRRVYRGEGDEIGEGIVRRIQTILYDFKSE